MEEIAFVTHHWGDKYGLNYVQKLAAGVKRHMAASYRFICLSENPISIPGVESRPIDFDDLYLTKRPGCFVRLKLFDPEYQKRLGLTGRIVSLDLDAIICGPLEPLFDRPEPFAILRGINTTNPCPYNGSLWMLRADHRPDVWADFSPDAAAKVPYHAFPDDQGWLWYKFPDAPGWGPIDGVYGFKKRGWPDGDGLPANARIVAFPGWRDPERFQHLAWIDKNWTK